ncbi:hypothetical protein BaRGS_00006696 [Batillaria attramentaria]|uniref:Uncharacterized protein n=1 Tax=Batillaria attramentaria TaxID=370345 RepID=A0ABD0LQX1_9CAEN
MDCGIPPAPQKVKPLKGRPCQHGACLLSDHPGTQLRLAKEITAAEDKHGFAQVLPCHMVSSQLPENEVIERSNRQEEQQENEGSRSLGCSLDTSIRTP